MIAPISLIHKALLVSVQRTFPVNKVTVAMFVLNYLNNDSYNYLGRRIWMFNSYAFFTEQILA